MAGRGHKKIEAQSPKYRTQEHWETRQRREDNKEDTDLNTQGRAG